MKKTTPFQCVYSPRLPELLFQLQISVAVSTYQAGKVIFLSAPTPEKLFQLPRNFRKAMGMSYRQNELVLATRDRILVMHNDPGLAATYPGKPGTYDTLFLPRSASFTGNVDMHDVHHTRDGIVGVNTLFSCLVKRSEEHSFDPFWSPPFIDALVPEDRCHLNGMAVDREGKIRYVTCLGMENKARGWRESLENGGALLEYPSGKAVCSGLAMPHSPRMHEDRLFFLESAAGWLSMFDPETREYERLVELNAFVRGLTIVDDYAFIGMSKIRENSSSFGRIPLARQKTEAGILVVQISTGKEVGRIVWQTSVDEIYDLIVLPGHRRPNLMTDMNDDHHLALSLPEKTYWAKKKLD